MGWSWFFFSFDLGFEFFRLFLISHLSYNQQSVSISISILQSQSQFPVVHFNFSLCSSHYLVATIPTPLRKHSNTSTATYSLYPSSVFLEYVLIIIIIIHQGAVCLFRWRFFALQFIHIVFVPYLSLSLLSSLSLFFSYTSLPFVHGPACLVSLSGGIIPIPSHPPSFRIRKYFAVILNLVPFSFSFPRPVSTLSAGASLFPSTYPLIAAYSGPSTKPLCISLEFFFLSS